MLTYAGSEVCIEDPGGQLQGWFDQYLDTQDLRDWCPSASAVSQRANSRSGFKHAVSLPRPNYPAPPRWKLNTLYWPTGAARWARCYVIVTDKQLAAIGNLQGPLRIGDGTNILTVQMYALPARRVFAATPIPPNQRLWLLPLVDQRYFWQFRDSGDYSARQAPQGNFQDWVTAFNLLGTALGVTIGVGSLGSYQLPDPDELSRNSENAAVLLDAVSHSVGQRVVVQVDGTVSSMNWQASASAYLANRAQPLMGGESSSDAIFPADINVAFLKYYYGAPDPNGDVYVSAQAGGGTSNEKTIHTTAFANFSSDPPTLQNGTEVDELAAQIAADYIASLNYRYDLSFTGIIPWSMSGYDDHVEWCVGRRSDRAEYQCFTRVQSIATNFGVEEQLSQFEDTPVYPSPARFILTADLLPLGSPSPSGQSAAGFHQTFNQTVQQWQTTADPVVVWDVENAFPCLAGQAGYADFKADSLRWEIISVDNRFLHGKLTSQLRSGQSATATIYVPVAGVETPEGSSVTVWDWAGTGGQIGAKIFPRWCVESSRWYAIAPLKPFLGRTTTAAGLPNGQSGQVMVYSVPLGGQQGNETQTGQTVTVFNKFFGFVPNDTWVWCEDDGDGPYIATTIEGDHLVGLVKPTGTSGVDLHLPASGNGTYASLRVQLQQLEPADQSTLNIDANAPTVLASVRHFPVIDGEQVTVVWTGSIFTIIASDYQCGVQC
ncbi:MAG: hypothetical protein KGL39_42405, partial [Patescibacteria group bacterium]|nr:hypothetical protein [Patescibacteria group bacterium]